MGFLKILKEKFFSKNIEIDQENMRLGSFDKQTLKEEILTKFTLDVGNEIARKLKDKEKCSVLHLHGFMHVL